MINVALVNAWRLYSFAGNEINTFIFFTGERERGKFPANNVRGPSELTSYV